jgi:beta-glucosidase/6-phospho-beta-glucosidase/beta-galactosidase
LFIKIKRDSFKDYSEILFKTYGDRVKHWTTLNEAEITALYSYMHGFNNPNPEKCRETEYCKQAYIIAHNFILSHATTAKLYREKYQVTLLSKWLVQKSPTLPRIRAMIVHKSLSNLH